MGCSGSKEVHQQVPKQSAKTANLEAPEVEWGHYEPFTEFPSPALLVKAQTDYKTANVKVEKDDQGVPQPSPPPSSKEDIMAAHDFSPIDQHASDGQSLRYAEEEYTDLVNFLVEPAKNDLDKVRAFFVWIGSQTPQKIFHHLGDRVPSEGSPLRAMATIMVKNLAGLYNEVLQKLCLAAGIPCVMQRCSAKGSSYRVGMPVKTHGNTLCLVYVEGAWRMIDQHWGSESVSATPDDEWQLVQDRGATTNRANYVQQVFHNIEEFYFLTDPYAMVYSHMCLEPKHQLLPRSVTSEEFNEMAYLEKGFFVLGMTNISHPKCKVICDNGTVLFEIGLGKKKGLFYYNLYKSALDGKIDRFKGATPKEFSWMSETDSTLKIKIEFPWIGKYKLEIQCNELENRRIRYDLCEYLIVVTQPMFGVEPRPIMPPGQDQLGITAPIKAMGIRAVQNEDGIIHAKKGEAEVSFSCQETKEIKIEAHINDSFKQNGRAGTAQTRKSILRHYRSVEGQISVLAKLAHSGNCMLNLNVIKETEHVQKMNYLIESDQECTDFISNYPEPLDRTGRIGDLVDDEENRLIPISHLCPQLDGPANGNTCFEMEQCSVKDLNIQTELILNNEIHLDAYVIHEREGQKHFFYSRFPRVGIYSLNIISNQSIKKVSLYQYIINVEKPDTQCLPFPRIHNCLPDGFKVIQPKDGKLSQNATVEFNFLVPDATEVCLKSASPQATYELSQNNENSWRGTVSVDSGVKELTLNATFKEEVCKDLLTYQIMDRDDENEKKFNRKKAEKEAMDTMKEIEEREQKMEREANHRRKQKEKEAKESEDDFKKNKSVYEKREKQLEDQALKKEKPPEKETDYTDIKLEHEMDDKNLEQKFKDAKKEADEGWKALYDKKNRKLMLERLKIAIARRDLHKMEDGVTDCSRAGIIDENGIIEKAKMMIRIEQAKADLQAAMDNKDEDEILEQIQNIEEDKLQYNLQPEVAEAKALLDRLSRARIFPNRVLDMDKKTMSEIRRYNNPPSSVHGVLQAALLLIGEDEETTAEWRTVQKQCNPHGKHGMSRRILDFDAANLQPEMAARSHEILQEVDLVELKQQSAGAAIFYVWAMGVIDKAKVDGDVMPADIHRQKEILGRLPPPPEEKSHEKYYRLQRAAEEAKKNAERDQQKETE